MDSLGSGWQLCHWCSCSIEPGSSVGRVINIFSDSKLFVASMNSLWVLLAQILDSYSSHISHSSRTLFFCKVMEALTESAETSFLQHPAETPSQNQPVTCNIVQDHRTIYHGIHSLFCPIFSRRVHTANVSHFAPMWPRGWGASPQFQPGRASQLVSTEFLI